ncbi:unnamed protein product [Amoebophrya sp. A120]|nr:unnamed protein product [Amoebophrya sp. A120]|eukprot:GSA120T00010647001.1
MATTSSSSSAPPPHLRATKPLVFQCMSQFYVLSPRGDTILTRDFRGDVVKGTAEMFFRKVTLFQHGEDCPPVFHQHGINYYFLKKNGLYFVATTSFNTNSNATLLLELLTKICKVFKDYCGTLTEESIRKNFVLLYELLDEMLDFGYPQTTSTEQLRLCVHNEAAAVLNENTVASGLQSAGTAVSNALGGGALKGVAALPNLTARTVPSNAVHRPVGPTQDKIVAKNEIFVDILERVTVLMNSSGQILNACVDGSIQMKSYLSGNPELKLALNEDLVIGAASGNNRFASVQLDDCNFHECVDLRDFDDQRILSFFPPDGEFAVMNYRITNELKVPFRIFPRVSFPPQQQADKVTSCELTITARAELPDTNYGGNVVFQCQFPKNLVASISATEVFQSSSGGSGSANAAQNTEQKKQVEFLPNENKLVWQLKKFPGNSEFTLKTRLNSMRGDRSRTSIFPGRELQLSQSWVMSLFRRKFSLKRIAMPKPTWTCVPYLHEMSLSIGFGFKWVEVRDSRDRDSASRSFAGAP